ncbi:MAG TPA: sulfite exporter TauE/SafE family protein [Roseomonas sp.]|jgi:hypothetical protein
MGLDQIALIFLGALAGGLVNGLTGFGTGITAMGIWLHVIPAPIAASLVIVCSVVSQLQTLPMIWRAIAWRRVLPFVIPGLLGVPVGTWLLPMIDQASFKAGIGAFLVAYPSYALLRRPGPGSAIGGSAADGTVGLCGGVLGGLAGLSGVLLVVWTDIRGWDKAQRRSVLQAFNLTIVVAALVSHAASGLLTGPVGLATLAALPGTIGGAWIGTRIYRRLGDRQFQQVVMGLLLVSGLTLIWSSL